MSKDSSIGNELVQAMQEVETYVKGESELPSRTVHVPDVIDIKSLRDERSMTQKDFAQRYGFTLGAVRDWEQGRRRPERAARILLTIIKQQPQLVEGILGRSIA